MDNYYMRFPSVLRTALSSGKVSLPTNLEKEFIPFTAYRGIRFTKNIKESTSRDDFLSQIELKAKGDLLYQQYLEDDIDNYGASLFLEKEELERALFLPRKNKAIAQGTVKDEVGAVSKNLKTMHVLWFLYDQTSPESDFKVIEYYEKMDGSQKYRTVKL